MKLFIAGTGPVYHQAKRLADAAGIPLTAEVSGADLILPVSGEEAARFLPDSRVIFCPEAWELCSSRVASDAFLREQSIPVPEYFPGGSEPYLVKPDRGEFGRGIWVTDDYCEAGGAVNAGFVTQEEIPGDVWSIVVTGGPGAYTVHAPVRLTFDALRHRSEAVCLPAPESSALEAHAVRAAGAMSMRGILELEAIFHLGIWKVTDMNARLPVLTPDALLTGGTNLLSVLLGR